MAAQINPRLLGLIEELPDGEAIVGWRNIAQAMRYTERQARRVAEDPAFPKRHARGRVYVLVPEFMSWWHGHIR